MRVTYDRKFKKGDLVKAKIGGPMMMVIEDSEEYASRFALKDGQHRDEYLCRFVDPRVSMVNHQSASSSALFGAKAENYADMELFKDAVFYQFELEQIKRK